MDLMTLDPNTRQPAKLVENYDSLIWTERFNTVGDFQIETGAVDAFMTLLPEGTMLTLRETNHVMIVETHKIDRKKNTPQKLTITGRSFESVLDRRVAIQSVAALTGGTDWNVVAPAPWDIAYYVMNYVATGNIDALDVYPSWVSLPQPSDYLTSGGPNKAWAVPRGKLLDVVLGFLQQELPADPSTTPTTPARAPHGIRTVRPAEGATSLAIQIYNGTDRSGTVYFDATRDLLDDGTYLFSKKDSANVGYYVASGQAGKMSEVTPEPTGLARRVTLVDASSTAISDVAILRGQVSQALTEAHETAMFDGSINQDLSPYKYGVDYNLGDIVKVVGDYGLSTNSRVTEYIRSEDSQGVKSYPTLTAIQF